MPMTIKSPAAAPTIFFTRFPFEWLQMVLRRHEWSRQSNNEPTTPPLSSQITALFRTWP